MGVEIVAQGVLWPQFYLNSLVRFRNLFVPRQLPPSLGTLKIYTKSDERNSRNIHPKSVPKPSTFLFRPTLRARVRPRSNCPRPTPTTQSVELERCQMTTTVTGV